MEFSVGSLEREGGSLRARLELRSRRLPRQDRAGGGDDEGKKHESEGRLRSHSYLLQALGFDAKGLIVSRLRRIRTPASRDARGGRERTSWRIRWQNAKDRGSGETDSDSTRDSSPALRAGHSGRGSLCLVSIPWRCDGDRESESQPDEPSDPRADPDRQPGPDPERGAGGARREGSVEPRRALSQRRGLARGSGGAAGEDRTPGGSPGTSRRVRGASPRRDVRHVGSSS